MIIWLFPTLALSGVVSAYALRVLLSSKNLGYIKLFLGLIPNMLLMTIHYKIAKFSTFPKLGYRPEVIDEYPFIGWLALICFLLHAGATPVKRDLTWFWKRKVRI